MWKTGRSEQFEGGDAQVTRDFVVLQAVTPDYRMATTYIPLAEIRHFRVEQPWTPPPARVEYPQGFPATSPAALPPVNSKPESVMHVSPGMAARKSTGRTVVTADGQTATLTPEGDIVGAALFAAGMPMGRVGL